MQRKPVSLLLWSLCLCLVLPQAAFAGDSKVSSGSQAQLARIYGSKELDAKRFGPSQWLEEGKAYTTVEPSAAVEEAKDIVRYDSATGARSILVSAASLVPTSGAKPLEIDGYEWSTDGARLLIFTNTKKVWRQNTRGDYWVLDVKGGKLHKVGAAWPESTLMFAKLSPDGQRVAYVHENDLWVEDVGSDKAIRLTSDGSATIINGTSDWVYEEEFFLRDGFRWSPDGRDIAFWRFDTSGVGSFTLLNNTDTLYPVLTNIPYPKAGTTNSAVTIGIVSASGGTARWVSLPGDPRNTYIPRMEWAGTGEVMLQQLNRLQNTNDVWLADAKTGQARRLLHDEDAAWVDINESWQWLPGDRGAPLGQRARWLAPRLGRAARNGRDGRDAAADPRRFRPSQRRRHRREQRFPLFHRFAPGRHTALSLPGPAGWQGLAGARHTSGSPGIELLQDLTRWSLRDPYALDGRLSSCYRPGGATISQGFSRARGQQEARRRRRAAHDATDRVFPGGHRRWSEARWMDDHAEGF